MLGLGAIDTSLYKELSKRYACSCLYRYIDIQLYQCTFRFNDFLKDLHTCIFHFSEDNLMPSSYHILSLDVSVGVFLSLFPTKCHGHSFWLKMIVFWEIMNPLNDFPGLTNRPSLYLSIYLSIYLSNLENHKRRSKNLWCWQRILIP